MVELENTPGVCPSCGKALGLKGICSACSQKEVDETRLVVVESVAIAKAPPSEEDRRKWLFAEIKQRTKGGRKLRKNQRLHGDIVARNRASDAEHGLPLEKPKSE